jgi:hypothetical protein
VGLGSCVSVGVKSRAERGFSPRGLRREGGIGRLPRRRWTNVRESDGALPCYFEFTSCRHQDQLTSGRE